MTLTPAHLQDLSHLLACANERGERVTDVNLSPFNRVLEHKAEDMTATVEAGLTLGAFQAELRKRGQWLPIDPPHEATLTIGELIASNLNGPRRFGYGTVGDYLIGIKVVLADGRVISPGGKVVKNVAGYDLAKLFIGGRGTLGIAVQATFKLRPVPAAEVFVQKTCKSREEAQATIEAVLDSELTPIVFDLYREGTSPVVVLGFAGTKPEVEWQLQKANALAVEEPSSLSHDTRFWSIPSGVAKISILPSRVVEAVAGLKETPYLARVGNGIVYHRGAPSTPKVDLPLHLFERLKREFDPKNILPGLSL